MAETELRGNLIRGEAIARVRVDPANPDLVYVEAFGRYP